jgi:hypothetical protein
MDHGPTNVHLSTRQTQPWSPMAAKHPHCLRSEAEAQWEEFFGVVRREAMWGKALSSSQSKRRKGAVRREKGPLEHSDRTVSSIGRCSKVNYHICSSGIRSCPELRTKLQAGPWVSTCASCLPSALLPKHVCLAFRPAAQTARRPVTA